MKADAFQRFETAQSGLLIPVALFLVGMISTVAAVNAIRDVAIAQNAAGKNQGANETVAPATVPAPATGIETAGANAGDAKPLNIESTDNNGESLTP